MSYLDYIALPCPNCGDSIAAGSVCETCAFAAQGLTALERYLGKVQAFEDYYAKRSAQRESAP